MKITRILCALIGHDDRDVTPSHSTCARCGGALDNDYVPGFGYLPAPPTRERWYLHEPSPIERMNVFRMRG